MPPSNSRRQYLRALGAVATLGLAGCNDDGEETRTAGARTAGSSSTVAPSETPSQRSTGGPSLSGTWTQFQYDTQNTGVSTESTGPETAPEALWTLRTGNTVMGTPVVQNGTVYAGSDDSNLYALDLITGETTWQLDTDGAVHGTPTVADGTVYAGSQDGFLYAASVDDGSQQWRFDAGGSTGGNDRAQVRTPPAVADGVVYVGDTAGRLFAVDAETGTEQWRFSTGGTLGIVTAPAVADGTVFVTSYDGSLYAVDAAEGTAVWAFELGEDVAWSAPTVTDELVYAGANDGQLHAVERDDGTRRWAYETGGNVFSSPAADGDRVYVGGGDSLYALGASDGEYLWRKLTGGSVYSDPAVANGLVYVGSYDQHVYALSVDSGTVEWRFDVGATTVSGPAVVNGGVLVGDFSGDVHALGPAGTPTVTETTRSGSAGSAAGRDSPRSPWWSTWGYDATNSHHNPNTSVPRSAVGVDTELGAGGYGRPVVVDGTAYVVGRQEVAAVDLPTGDRGWTVDISGRRAASAPAVTSDTVYVHDTRLRALDRMSGEVRWTLGGESSILRVSPPTVVDGTVYIGRQSFGRGGRLTAAGMYAVSAADGIREWYFGDAVGWGGAPAYADGSIYFGSDDDHVYALDAQSGNEQWRFQTGHSILSAPVVADGTVYVGSLDNSLYALDAATGTEQWTAETFGGVRTSPAVADGTVYVVSGGISRTGNVYALDAQSGTEEWVFRCNRPVLSQPIVADGIVYVQLSQDEEGFGTIYGLRTDNGSVVTRVDGAPEGMQPITPVAANDTLYAQLIESVTGSDTEPGDSLPTVRLARLAEGAGSETTETCSSQPRTEPRGSVRGPWPSEQFDAANTGGTDREVGLVVLSTHSDGVYAFDANDGTVRWSTDPISGIQSAPTVANGRVFVGINRNPFGVYALDATDGQRLWSARIGDCKTTPFVSGDTAYVGTSDSTLVALDTATGETRWQVSGNRRLLSTPTVREGTVYIGDEAGDVYAVDAASGERQWATLVRQDDEIKTPVAAGSDHVYAAAIQGHLYALSPDTGERQWEYAELSEFLSSGVVVAGGQVFVADTEQLHVVGAQNGTRQWQFNPGNGTPTTAAVADESAFVGTDGGQLHRFDATTGERTWQTDTAAAVRATPIVSRETVYAATEAGHVHAMDRETGTERWRTEAVGMADKMNADGTLAAVGGVEVTSDE